jgi:zinc/manganese transport system permease protein
MDIFDLMTLPFLECLVLVGIHSYLGLHVIRRRVIFVDLALAQIAALGTTVAFVFAIDPDSTGAYVFSLLFTLVGAAVFSLTRVRRDKVPQEAVIGLVYALAAAVGILVVFYAPHGAEHIQQILSGSILWVEAGEVLTAAVVYAFVGAFHYVFRDRFLRISEDADRAAAEGLNVRLWDFLFYASFGLVITHSVRTAGVLLVFVFLVVPAILAVMLTDRLGRQLAIGWTAGTFVTVLGLALSYYGDLPSGPAVVALYGAVLFLTAVVVYVVRAPVRRAALTRVAGGAAVLLALTLGFRALGHWMAGQPSLARGGTAGAAARAVDGGAQAALADPGTGEAEAAALAATLERRDLVEKRALLAQSADRGQLRAVLAQAADPEVRLTVAERLLMLGEGEGGQALLALLADSATAPMLRDEALARLAARFGDDVRGFDPWDDPTTPANRAALDRWRAVLAAPRQASAARDTEVGTP